MTEPLGGVGSVSARLNDLGARIAALTGDAITPSSIGGAYTTFAARATAGTSFATVLADADATATASGAPATGTTGAAGLPGGPVSAAWSIPWLAGNAPAGRTTAGVAATRGGETAAASGILRTSAGEAAAVDDPLAVVSPVKGRISQRFGPTDNEASVAHVVDGVSYAHFHDGIDIAAPAGRPVKAMAAGKVIFAGTYPDGANVIRVKHADGSIALYAHLGDGFDVGKGDKVAAGQQIGVVGTSGTSSGPHLHLELLVRGEDADPQPVLERGRLPGRPNGRMDLSVIGSTGLDAATRDALARFDRVANDIPFAREIRDAAVRAGIDPLLLASLVKAESAFHPNSKSSAGAMGLCQLMPATARAMGVEDPYDPEQNLRAGARYLARNLHIFGRTDVALAAYQAGKGAVREAGGIPDSPTTRHYIKRILQTWAGYQEDAA